MRFLTFSVTQLKQVMITLCLLMISSLAFAEVSLEQGAWVKNQTYYQMGHNSIPKIPIIGAPSDVDWQRSAMLHDGQVYRLYFFKQNTADTLYQFGFNPSTNQYEYGYQSIPVLKITGIPKEANSKNIAMLHDGTDYRLYMLGKGKNRFTLYQFAFNRSNNNYEYGYRSIKTIPIVGMPKDAKVSRWAMLHDGKHYRLYFGKKNSQSMYQAAFDRSKNSYIWKYQSIPEMKLKGFQNSPSDFLMLHDRRAYRFYYLNK